jgi:hypothetical protein
MNKFPNSRTARQRTSRTNEIGGPGFDESDPGVVISEQITYGKHLPCMHRLEIKVLEGEFQVDPVTSNAGACLLLLWISTASGTRNEQKDGRKDEPTYAAVIPGREK